MFCIYRFIHRIRGILLSMFYAHVSCRVCLFGVHLALVADSFSLWVCVILETLTLRSFNCVSWADQSMHCGASVTMSQVRCHVRFTVALNIVAGITELRRSLRQCWQSKYWIVVLIFKHTLHELPIENFLLLGSQFSQIFCILGYFRRDMFNLFYFRNCLCLQNHIVPFLNCPDYLS